MLEGEGEMQVQGEAIRRNGVRWRLKGAGSARRGMWLPLLLENWHMLLMSSRYRS